MNYSVDEIRNLLKYGADITGILQNGRVNDLNMLNELADEMLNHPTKPVDPKVFLDAVLACPTLKYDPVNFNLVIDGDLVKIKYDLVQKSADKGASIGNQLTVFFDEGHAFVKLDCSNCDKGEAASVYVGLYPDDTDAHSREGVVDYGINIKEVGSLFVQIPKGLVGYLLKQQNANPTLERWASGDKYLLMQEFGGVLSKTSLNFAGNARDPRTLDYLKRIPSKSFDITERAADELFTRIDHLVNTCDADLEYQLFGSNCIDFAQDMFKRAGLSYVDIVEDVHGFRYPQNIFGVYKAIQDTSRAIAGDPAARGAISALPTSPLFVDTAQHIAVAAVGMYPLAAYIVGAAKNITKSAASSAYQYIFGTKIGEEELDKARDSLSSTKTTALISLNRLRQEFLGIRRECYSRDLEIANAAYDEDSRRYTSNKGEEAIARVRFMADLDNEFRDLSKQMVQLIKSKNALTPDSTDIAVKEVLEADKEMTKKIAELAQKDLSILAKDDLHRAKLQALQSQLTIQDSAASGPHNKAKRKEQGIAL